MKYGEEEFDDMLKAMIKTSTEEDVNKRVRHSCYSECIEHAEEMSWHLYGNTPDALLDRVRPREDPEVTAYRKANYEPTTKSAADKAINIVSKIFNPNLYSIRWKDQSESAKKLQKYTLEDYPEHNTLVNFTKDVLLRKMLADPNGVAVVKLQEIPDKQNEELTPVMSLYGSANIWNFDLDHYLIFLRTEEVKQKNGGRITVYYFEYYDKTDFICFSAYMTSTGRVIIDPEEEYPHNFGEIPVWRLQGVPESKDNGTLMYKSFFNAAAPYWNLAIIHESDVLGAFINHMHPLRAELSEPCTYVFQNRFVCKQGVLLLESGEKMQCPHCEGSGYKPMGPYGVFKISRSKIDEDGGRVSASQAVEYINVPTEPTKMLEERAARMEKKGMWAINMDVEDEVGENQSGVAKVIDRSAQYDTLYNIGTVVFDTHLQNAFYFFDRYMNEVADKSAGKDASPNLPEINKPTQFDIASTAELVANYKVAKDSGLDRNFLQIKQIEIGTRDLTTNPDLKKFTNLLLDLDPLPGMDDNAISLNVSKFFIRQVDAVIHSNLKRFIERAMTEDKGFLEKKKEEQKDKLEEYGQEYVKETKPKIDPNIIAYGAEQKKMATQLPFGQGK